MIIPVLLYHNIDLKSNIKNPFITVTNDKFKQDMLFVKNNFTPIFVQDLADYVYQKKALPENSILITFDDGYQTLYNYAYSILCELNIKATIGLIVSQVGKLGQFPKLNWDQIKEMYHSGFVDFQSHSYDLHTEHDRKGSLKKEEENDIEYIKFFQTDLFLAKNIIEQHLQNNVIAYFYPYGYHDTLSEHVIRYHSSYLISFIAKPRYLTVPSSIKMSHPLSLYNIQRLNIPNHIHLDLIKN